MKSSFNHPALYISLLSDVAQNVKTTHAVYSTTMMDEVTLRTPDILMNGATTEQIISHCCPTIDVSKLLISDIQYILASIKLASSGQMLEVLFHCPKCDTIDPYEINIQHLLSSLSAKLWYTPLRLDGLTINLAPPTYRSFNEYAIDNFRFNKQLYMISQLENAEDVASVVETLIDQQRHRLIDFQATAIKFIQPDNAKPVADPAFIYEWFNQCDLLIQKKVTAYIDECYQKCMIPTMTLNCTGESCKAPFSVPINLDACVQFRNKLVKLTDQDIMNEMGRMGNETKELANELLKMIWFMRGSISYDEAWNLTSHEKQCIGKIIESNIDISKKINHPII